MVEKRSEAIAAYHETIKLKPDYAEAYNNLGTALDDEGKSEWAIATYREAIQLRPQLAEAHINLGLLLRDRGVHGEAIAELRNGVKLGWNGDANGRVRDILLAYRLPGILKGHDRPVNNAERIEFAEYCYRRALHLASTRLYIGALSIDPKLVDDLDVSVRFNAACAAALAGCGQGKDDPPPDEAAKGKLRQQAIEWLKADLAARAKGLQKILTKHRNELTLPARSWQARLVRSIRRWTVDSDLAGVRDEANLKKLPYEERKDWQAFWAEVAALLKKADEH